MTDFKTSRSLRKVERDVLIPKYMERQILAELCHPEHQAFLNCAKQTGIMVTFKCKHLKKEFDQCSKDWMNDEEFRKKVTEEYLDRRRRYRETGIPDKSEYRRIGT